MSELVSQNAIERMLVLDQSAGESQVAELLEMSRALWMEADTRGDFYRIARAAMIWSFKNAVLPDGRAKWQVTQITDAPLSFTWQEYCVAHLGLAPSTASNSMRNWEIFNIKFGYHFEDLVRAGLQRMNIARSAFAKSDSVPEELVLAVFGDTNICTVCGSYVMYEGKLPETCPECGKPFKPRAPKSVAEVQMLMDAYNEKKRDEKEGARCQADIENEGDLIRVVPRWVMGNEEDSLPVWEIPVLERNEVSREGGIRKEDVGAFEKWLRKRFK